MIAIGRAWTPGRRFPSFLAGSGPSGARHGGDGGEPPQ